MKHLSALILSLLLVSAAHAADACPRAAKFADMCVPYQTMSEVLAAVDYEAMGEVGPSVAKEVTSVPTVLALAKSVWIFKPTLRQLRSKYFLPVLKMIAQLKALNKADRSNRESYLKLNQEVYVNLVLTSLDTTLKTYKVAPEAVNAAQKVAFAWLWASASDTKASQQPQWLSLLLGHFTAVSSDIIFNNSKTSLKERMERLIAMEGDIQNAVNLLCRETPDDEECKGSTK